MKSDVKIFINSLLYIIFNKKFDFKSHMTILSKMLQKGLDLAKNNTNILRFSILSGMVFGYAGVVDKYKIICKYGRTPYKNTKYGSTLRAIYYTIYILENGVRDFLIGICAGGLSITMYNSPKIMFSLCIFGGVYGMILKLQSIMSEKKDYSNTPFLELPIPPIKWMYNMFGIIKYGIFGSIIGMWVPFILPLGIIIYINPKSSSYLAKPPFESYFNNTKNKN